MRKFFFLIFAAIMAVYFLGCGSRSGDPVLVSSSSNSGQPQSGMLLVSSDQRLQVVIPSQALPPGVIPILIEEPGGAPGFLGATYRLEPAGLLLNQAIRVRIRQDSVPGRTEGIPSVTLEGPVPLKSTSEAGFLGANVLYFSRLGLSFSSPVTDSENSKALFIKNYLKGIEILSRQDYSEGEGIENPFAMSTAAYGPVPLQAGDRLSSIDRPLVAKPNPETGSIEVERLPYQEFSVTGFSDFFWVDLLDGVLSDHPTLFVVLDRNTGQFLEFLRGTHPRINGEEILFNQEVRDASPLRLVASQSSAFRLESPEVESLVHPQQVTSNCRRIAILITLTGESYARTAFSQMRLALTRIGFDGRVYERTIIKNPSVEYRALIDEIVSDQKELCQCQGADEVFVYITGHGSVPSLGFLEFGRNPEPGAGFSPRDSNGKDTGNDTLAFEDFLAELNRICLTPSGEFKVLVEACYAKEAQDLVSRSRKRAREFKDKGRELLPVDKRLACFRGDIIVASGRNGGFTYASAGLFPMVFAEGMESSGNRINMFSSFSKALEIGTSLSRPLSRVYLSLAKPSIETYPRSNSLVSESDCSCDCVPEDGALTPTPVPDDSPTPSLLPVSMSVDTNPNLLGDQLLVEFAHTIGVTPCPQALSPVVVRNTGNQDLMVTITVGNFLALTGDTAFSLTPGESRTLPVSFNCQTNMSFESAVAVRGVNTDGSELTQSALYRGTLAVSSCQSAVRWEVAATEANSVTFIPTATNVIINGGQAVTLNPGEHFQQSFETAIQGLNYLIVFNEMQFDQGFNLEVPCGRIQRFTFDGGVSFGQEVFP